MAIDKACADYYQFRPGAAPGAQVQERSTPACGRTCQQVKQVWQVWQVWHVRQVWQHTTPLLCRYNQRSFGGATLAPRAHPLTARPLRYEPDLSPLAGHRANGVCAMP